MFVLTSDIRDVVMSMDGQPACLTTEGMLDVIALAACARTDCGHAGIEKWAPFSYCARITNLYMQDTNETAV